MQTHSVKKVTVSSSGIGIEFGQSMHHILEETALSNITAYPPTLSAQQNQEQTTAVID